MLSGSSQRKVITEQQMESRNKVLLVDDDPALLETYHELLSRLPSRPEIHTVNSGARALARLESEPFRLLICDLKMPKMDGLQVLSIVRRKFPQMRTVALTAVGDEQFRTRIYALGVDLFWHKPSNEQEIKLFLECLESFLGAEADQPGFRGIQSKSLMDIVQLECISQSSSVLRITNGSQSGRIWIQDGEVIDAEADDLRGTDAFRKLFSWRTGAFEIMPSEPERERTITQSYNGLLLDSAQILDEELGRKEGEAVQGEEQVSQQIAGMPELEFALLWQEGAEKPVVARGMDERDHVSAWMRSSLEDFRKLGERLQAGPVNCIQGRGITHNVTIGQTSTSSYCLGWKGSLSPAKIRELTRKVASLWGS